MKFRKPLLYTLLAIFAYMGIACGTLDKTLTPFATPTLEITTVNFGHTLQLPTKTPVPLLTRTPLPTLSPNKAQDLVAGFLKDNGGCRLPCWWGIVPGQTNWRDVEESLSPITTSIYETTSKKSNPRYIGMFFPAPYPSTGEFRQIYLVRNDIVNQIEILPQHFSKYSIPNQLLQEFGDPEMIFLGGSVEQPQSFQLILYYPSRGIFALYSNELRPFQQQEVLDVCFTKAEIKYVDMFLWDPADSFSETLDYVFKQYSRPFYEIELVTNLTINEFSEFFTSPDHVDCFQTPSKFWSN